MDPLPTTSPLAGPEPTRADHLLTAPSESSPSPGAGPPARIGRFELRRRLGAGAFGEVYCAFDPHLDREVALKVARPGTLTTPDRVQRFLREARAAANLRHPHIVPLFETGQDGDHHFTASAFIPGGTLEKELAAAQGPLAFRRTADLIRKLAEALGYAHRQGIIHRDVKPANILLDERGDPLVADFGLAARAEGEEKLT
jgi:serine/threonine protein kinase